LAPIPGEGEGTIVDADAESSTTFLPVVIVVVPVDVLVDVVAVEDGPARSPPPTAPNGEPSATPKIGGANPKSTIPGSTPPLALKRLSA